MSNLYGDPFNRSIPAQGCNCLSCQDARKHQYSDGCGCLNCVVQRDQAEQRMKAATCKCGHVGAECFNDGYCDVDSYEYYLTHRKAGSPCLIEIEYWKEKHFDWGKRYHALKQHCDDVLAEKNALEVTLRQEINDLQADYANDCHAWANMYNSLSETHYGEEWKELDRIEQLETTIRVLSGMVD
jgi:hypothetical protein